VVVAIILDQHRIQAQLVSECCDFFTALESLLRTIFFIIAMRASLHK
jgi:hypothetical protein